MSSGKHFDCYKTLDVTVSLILLPDPYRSWIIKRGPWEPHDLGCQPSVEPNTHLCHVFVKI